QRTLELEPDDDVEVVGHLAGLHADDARRGMIDHASKPVERDVVERLVERRLKLRIEVLPEPVTSSDGVLPQARARLREPEPHRLAKRSSVVLGVETLVVQRVPDLVKQREQALREVARMVSDGDADVAGTDCSAERVAADVETAALEIGPEGGGGGRGG